MGALDKWVRAARAAERALTGTIRPVLDDQAQRVADRVEREEYVHPADVGFLFDPEAEHLEFMQVVKPRLGEIMAVGAAAGGGQGYIDILAGDAWELPDSVMRAILTAVDELAEQPYWRAIQALTSEDLSRIIGFGSSEGWSTYRIAKSIREEIGGKAAHRRAMRIARTETTGCLNRGHLIQDEEMERAGLVIVRRWWTVGDNDVRASHQYMNGQTVQGTRGLFNVGGVLVPHPGHWSLPARDRVRCRCTTASDII